MSNSREEDRGDRQEDREGDGEVASAIRGYRDQVVAEAELARGDLDEIEDHLRTLTDELRGTGMPAALAVTEAAHRLGDPRELAREHARVRSAFGAKLSRTRAWSAAMLLAPMLVYFGISVLPYEGWWSRAGLELGFGAVLLVALVARLSWARPVLLGGMGFFVLPAALWLGVAPGSTPLWLVWQLGIVAFLVPWHRRELTAAGAGMALQVWGYGAAALALGFQVTTNDGSWSAVAPAAQIALGAAIVATTGQLLRARWSAVASGVSTFTLLLAMHEMWSLTFRFAHPDLYRVCLLGMIASGAAASAASTLLAWRTARSSLGTLESVLR